MDEDETRSHASQSNNVWHVERIYAIYRATLVGVECPWKLGSMGRPVFSNVVIDYNRYECSPLGIGHHSKWYAEIKQTARIYQQQYH